jgi:molybdopterin/thiamine biosynthesis adenylyltransferase
MSAGSKISAVFEALAQRGFKYLGPAEDGWHRLEGELKTSQGAHLCEVQLDPKFYDLPVVRLLKAPANLPRVVPHLAGGVHLCYIARGSVVLDIFDPVGQTLACLERATEVLDQVLQGKMLEDLEEEFHMQWGHDECVVDMQDARLGRQDSMVLQAGSETYAVVTDDRGRTLRKLKALQWSVHEGRVETFRIRTHAKPRPHITNWPPRTVGDVLQWQGLLDQRARKKIEKRLFEAYNGTAWGSIVLLESPLLTYAFGVEFKRAARRARDPKPKLAVLRSQTITPMTVVRIDDRYLAERNSPGKQTLAGKNIALIGCGTIGGYLADMLVKAGAGTSGGRLTLVDFEKLLPQNLGRHRLGFTSLFANKAKALALELERAAPGATIRALPVDVKDAQLGQQDLLVDATGEEALGHWLSSKHLPTTTLLSAWIEGPGVAVRTLLSAKGGGACYRCLCLANRRGELLSVKGGVPTVLAGQGCEGLYVPFPASVSVQAASLAADAAIDWVNGVSSPALRTRVLQSKYEAATPDCDPPRVGGCPACPS